VGLTSTALRAVFGAAIVALSCSMIAPAARAQTTATTLPTIRIATTPIENGAEVYYAKEMGFFTKAGLNVELQDIQSGSAVASAVAASAVDVGFASLVPLAIAHVKKIPFVLIAPGAVWTQTAKNSGLFVSSTSTIRSGKDLNNKVLSTAGLGTLTEFAARAWIDGTGGDATTVKFAEMSYSTMPAALDAGRVSGSLVNEPYFQVAGKTGKLIGYPYDYVAKSFLIAGWFSTSQWATDHPDLVAKFASAMRETAMWANQPQNQARTLEILEKYTHIDPAMAATMIRVRFGDTLSAAAIQPQIDVSAKYGGFPTFPAREILLPGAK
jgi:NitT/TauT family transport system substrate-binding protein